MDASIWGAFPFIASFYLGYLVIVSHVKFEIVFTYAILLLVILAFSLQIEILFWKSAILPNLILIDLALSIALSTKNARNFFSSKTQLAKIFLVRDTTLALLPILVTMQMYYPSSWRLAFLYILFLSDFALCIALSPAQVYLFGLKESGKSIKPLEIIYSPILDQKDTLKGQPLIEYIHADIVAVHGLGSVPDRAWESKSNATKETQKKATGDLPVDLIGEQLSTTNPNWLRDFLPRDYPYVRIMTFNHDTAWQSFASRQSLREYADSLLRVLNRERENPEEKCRPIIFIGYSFGGIIVKQAVVLAAEDSKLGGDDFRRNIREAPCSFIFIGTPHRGSSLTVAGKILALFSYWAGSSTKLLELIERQSIANSELYTKFVEYYKPEDTDIVNFYETEPEVVAGFPVMTAVDKDSAHIDHTVGIALPRKHRNIHKFNSIEDDGYQSIKEQIVRMVKSLSKSEDQKPGEPPQKPQDLNQAVDQYLESIALPSSFIPEIVPPKRQVQVSESSNIRASLDWFFDSLEFNTWNSGKSSSFLWCSGGLGSGKTVLSCYLAKFLSSREASMRRRDIISIFCGSFKQQAESIEIERILSNIVRQLLQKDSTRLYCVSQQHPPKDWLPTRVPLSFRKDFLPSLWSLIWDSLIASSDREIVLIFDGVNEIRPQEAREAFLANIVTYFNRAKSEKHIAIKFFVTSRPFEDIQKALEEVPSIEKDKERQACLRTLKFEEYNARQNRVAVAEENTGDWIFSHHAFRTWDESPDSSLLWLHGKPGSGKSTLAKRLAISKTNESEEFMRMKGNNTSHTHTEEIKIPEDEYTGYVDLLASDSDIIIASFFYSFRGGKTETSHTLMLRSLLYQILRGNSRLFPLFQSTYRQLSKINSIPEWSYESLKSVFNSLRSCQFQLRIYIIVDAMDESENLGRPEILDFLSNLRLSTPPCVFKVFIASRPHYDIQVHLKECNHIILQDENLSDIKAVIIKGLNDLSKDHKIPERNLDTVRDNLIKRCEGVFLWVSLVLKELKELAPDGVSEVDIKNLLKSLPSDLGELYKHIVTRLKESRKGDQMNEGQKMMAWAAFAERPMTMDELRDAIVIPSDPKPFPLLDFSISKLRISNFDRRIANNCGGLLEIRPGNIVQLLHQTTRDFILDKSLAEPFDTDELRGDMEIAIVCLRYLILLSQVRVGCGKDGVQDTQSFLSELSNLQLLDYVLAFLPKHMDHLKSYGIPQLVRDELSRLIKILRQNPQSQVYDLLERWCEIDLDNPIGLEIHQERAKQSRNTMLVIAIRKGYPSVVILLLRAHAEINGLSNGLFPLGEAASKGHEVVVRLLLDRGANVSGRDKNGKTALHLAAEGGHTEILQTLLNRGAGISGRDKNGKIALHLAAEGGHAEILQALLNRGANVNETDKNGKTALYLAAEGGHTESLQILLYRGAKTSEGDSDGKTALHLAAEGGHTEALQALLDGGARINEGDNNWKTALHLAAERGYTKTVQALLDRGAETQETDFNGRTALQWAAERGHLKVLESLLSRGPNINLAAIDNNGRTALQAAAKSGHLEIVEFLKRHKKTRS